MNDYIKVAPVKKFTDFIHMKKLICLNTYIYIYKHVNNDITSDIRDFGPEESPRNFGVPTGIRDLELSDDRFLDFSGFRFPLIAPLAVYDIAIRTKEQYFFFF